MFDISDVAQITNITDDELWAISNTNIGAHIRTKIAEITQKNQNTHKTNNFIFANLFINYNFNANIVCRVLVTWRFAFANPRASLYSSFEIEIERDVNHPAPNAN